MKSKLIMTALLGLSLLVPVLAAEHVHPAAQTSPQHQPQHGQPQHGQHHVDHQAHKQQCEAYFKTMKSEIASLKGLKGEAKVEQLAGMFEKMFAHQSMMHEHMQSMHQKMMEKHGQPAQPAPAH